MNKTIKIIIGVFSAIVIAIASAVGYYSYEVKKDIIFPGIKIEGTSLSGLSKLEAKKKLEEIYKNQREENTIRFLTDVTSYRYTHERLGLEENIDKAIEDAYSLGRSKDNLKNLVQVVYAGIMGKNIPIDKSFNKFKLNGAINDMAEKIFSAAKNAEFSLKDGHVEIIPEKVGRYLDLRETENLILKDINATEIKLPVYTVDAEIKSDEFSGINGVIGKFTTNYKSSESNRKHNIKIGADLISNKLVKPGQEISFNDKVGEISANTGFKNAGVIINGEFDRGVGGGICQVSTTLYNALLKADISIKERNNHTRPISYVPKGTDAAVVRGYKDLKFVNNFDFPIYITSYADGNDIEFTVYGDTTKKDYDVEIVAKLQGTSSPQTIKRYSSSVPAGQTKVEKSGSTGYYYKTYKSIIKNGETISTEQISTSSYPAQTKIILYGPDKPAETTNDKDSKSDSKSTSKESSKSKENSSKTNKTSKKAS